jgi:hypothetical protein
MIAGSMARRSIAGLLGLGTVPNELQRSKEADSRIRTCEINYQSHGHEIADSHSPKNIGRHLTSETLLTSHNGHPTYTEQRKASKAAVVSRVCKDDNSSWKDSSTNP